MKTLVYVSLICSAVVSGPDAEAQDSAPSLAQTIEYIQDNAKDATWFYQPGRTLDSSDRRLTNFRIDANGMIRLDFTLPDCRAGTASMTFNSRDVEFENPVPNQEIVGFSCTGSSCIDVQVKVNYCLSPTSRAVVRMGWETNRDQQFRVKEIKINMHGNQGPSFVKALKHYQMLVGGKKKQLF